MGEMIRGKQDFLPCGRFPNAEADPNPYRTLDGQSAALKCRPDLGLHLSADYSVPY